jgi:hypothetical protein
MKQKWRLSSHDTWTEDPDFELLKKFILKKAETAKRKVVYNQERAIEGSFGGPAISIKSPTRPTSPLQPTVVAPTVVPAPATTPDSAPDLIGTPKLTSAPTNATARSPRRCIWCDSTEHIRQSCRELPIAIHKGQIRFNNDNRIVNVTTGQEVPTNYHRGGMKTLVL